LLGPVQLRVLALALASLIGACVDPPGTEVAEDPNDGLLRDFVDGKFDAAGHPLNAKVIEPGALTGEGCGGAVRDGGRELRGTCEVQLPASATTGVTINARIRVRRTPSAGQIVSLRTLDANGTELGVETLTVERLRSTNRWLDIPITPADGLQAAKIGVEVAPGAKVDLAYVEVFPKRLDLVISPGSGVYRDTDRITFELPKGRNIERIQADGVDILPRLVQLLDSGKAKRTTTEFRTLIDVAVGDLLPTRTDVVELRAHSQGDTSRTQVRRVPAPCAFEGDPNGEKVLITGFQPFPADGWHENISSVAVTALDPTALRGAQVMRLILPVEYDRAAATVTDVIERCQPSSVISFGQGGWSIALEQASYNLQDTGELAGGAPDNRGILRAAAMIDPTAPATRETLLPLDAINSELVAAGEAPQLSVDPGRYICNNVMFAGVGAMAQRGGRAGFIHLPYTTSFDDAARQRWGHVAQVAVQATVDAD
jgi:pyroglutamyl-peptidase